MIYAYDYTIINCLYVTFTCCFKVVKELSRVDEGCIILPVCLFHLQDGPTIRVACIRAQAKKPFQLPRTKMSCATDTGSISANNILKSKESIFLGLISTHRWFFIRTRNQFDESEDQISLCVGGACLLRIIPFQMCSNFCTGGFLTRCHHRWISGNWWTRSRCEAWNVRMIMLYSLVHIVLPVFDRNSLFVFPPFPWHIFSYGKDGHSIISAQNLWWSEVSRCNTPSIEKCFELGNHILSDRQRPWW